MINTGIRIRVNCDISRLHRRTGDLLVFTHNDGRYGLVSSPVRLDPRIPSVSAEDRRIFVSLLRVVDLGPAWGEPS